MVGIRQEIQPMDRHQVVPFVITVFLFYFMVGVVAGGLEYFINISGQDHANYQADVIKLVERCLPEGGNLTAWEIGVRENRMDNVTCQLYEKIKERCKFDGNVNASTEYLKILLADAESLCKQKKYTERASEKLWNEDNKTLNVSIVFKKENKLVGKIKNDEETSDLECVLLLLLAILYMVVALVIASLLHKRTIRLPGSSLAGSSEERNNILIV